MYYYYVFPSHNTQDFLENDYIGQKTRWKVFFEYQYIMTYHSEK